MIGRWWIGDATSCVAFSFLMGNIQNTLGPALFIAMTTEIAASYICESSIGWMTALAALAASIGNARIHQRWGYTSKPDVDGERWTVVATTVMCVAFHIYCRRLSGGMSATGVPTGLLWNVCLLSLLSIMIYATMSVGDNDEDTGYRRWDAISVCFGAAAACFASVLSAIFVRDGIVESVVVLTLATVSAATTTLYVSHM